jgi:hypothetical protein
MLLQEEEDLEQCKDVLYSKKWSINRAILLHGQGEEEAFTDEQHCKATTFIGHL